MSKSKSEPESWPVISPTKWKKVHKFITADQSIDNMKATDLQVGGGHYTSMVIQPYEFCYRNSLDYLQSNVIKYVCRFRQKGGKKDLEKAIHTLKVLMEFEYGEDTPT